MEFSYNFDATMRSLSRSNTSLPNEQFEIEDPTARYGFLDVCVDVNKDGGEIPTMALSTVTDILSRNGLPDEGIKLVIKLNVSYHSKTCTGADTILKAFTRNYGRLLKVITPKGEVYYGGTGIILDSDFNTLLYITRDIKIGENNRTILSNEIKVHINPTVFIDDSKVLNKAIVKKCIAYYLTHTFGGWGENPVTSKILVDCGENFFRRPAKPESANINEDVNKLLRDNIKELLEQVDYDRR